MRYVLVFVLQLSWIHGSKALPVDGGCFDKLTAMADEIVGEVGPGHNFVLSSSTPVQCSWRIETERYVDRIYFTTTYQHFAGDDFLEMYSVGAKQELKSLTAGRGFNALTPIPREMVLYNATSAVMVVLTASANTTRFVMKYEGLARQAVWMQQSPWILFWIALAAVFFAIWSCVALYIMFMRQSSMANIGMRSGFIRRRAYPQLEEYERNEQDLEEQRTSALATLPVETYLEKRRSSQHSQGSRRSAVSLTYERGSTRCASTDSMRLASQSSFDQPEGGFTPTTQRPPLVTEEDGQLQGAPEACGDPEADCEGGDARDACGQCEDRGGEGAGQAAAEPGASVAAVEPPSDGDEPEECCLCMEAFAEDALVRVLPCEHFFHTACIATWFDANKYRARSCPLCKRDPLTDFSGMEEETPGAPLAAPSAASPPAAAAPPGTISPAAAAPAPVVPVARAPSPPEAASGDMEGTAASAQADGRVSSVLDEVSISITDDCPAVYGGV